MSILIQCDVGDLIVVRGALQDANGQGVTGATVTARSIPPSGVEAALGSASEEGGGVYAIEYEPAVAGRHIIRFDSAAPNTAAAEGVVYVRETRFS